MKSSSPDETFAIGERLAGDLKDGDIVLLFGGLGAGKTLFTKGILNGLGYDMNEVTSPSFALVNLYRTERFDAYHIDLWRVEGPNAAESAGLDEILEKDATVAIVEWAERLQNPVFPGRVIRIEIDGEGNEPRKILVHIPDS